MLRGLYSAASGLSAVMFRNEIEINNLTNSKTNGYKKEEVLFKSFQDELNSMMSYQKPLTAGKKPVGKIGRGVMVSDIFTYYNLQGDLVHTGRELDIAVNGQGYLVLENKAGEIVYTRNGSFNLDSKARLVNNDGHIVLGSNGPLEIKGKLVDIYDDGRVFVDGEFIDTLQLVNLEEPKKIGSSLYVTDKPISESNAEIKQGFLEMSNANPIEGMTKYLKNLRAYEANQKIVQAYDGTLEKVINEVGKV